MFKMYLIFIMLCGVSCGAGDYDSHQQADTTQVTVPEDLVPEHLKPGSSDTMFVADTLNRQ